MDVERLDREICDTHMEWHQSDKKRLQEWEILEKESYLFFRNTRYLHIAKLMKSPFSMLTTSSRWLVSAKWIRWNTIVHIILLYHPTVDLFCKIWKSLWVFCKHISSKSIDCIIRKFDCFFERGVCNNWKDWSKYFFSPDSHITRDIPENCWCKIGSC